MLLSLTRRWRMILWVSLALSPLVMCMGHMEGEAAQGAGALADALSDSSSSSTAAPSLPPPNVPLTLERCIAIGIANNPDVVAAGYDAERLRAERDVTAAQRRPAIDLLSSYNRSLNPQRLVPPSYPGEQSTYSRAAAASNLVLRLALFTGGRLDSQLDAADLLARAQEHRFARTKQELVFYISSTFYAILGQRRVIDSLESSHGVLQHHRDRVNSLIAARKAAQVDLLRVDVRLADLEQQLIRARNVLALQRRLLHNLLGLPDTYDLPSLEGELSIQGSPPDREAALASALERRSDYRAAALEAAAWARRVRAVRAQAAPQVYLQGTYGGRWASDITSGSSASEDVGALGVALELPILDGGRISAQVRQARAALAAAEQLTRKLRLKIELDVESACLNIVAAQKRAEAVEAAMREAREALRVEREKYDVGKGSITDVLDAQQALLESESSYHVALAEYNTALAELKLAAGEDE